MNYYNEWDAKAAAWIQQLIDDKQIPYGYVDSRSILEVQPSDLSGFTQCHFFAGVGGWSLALQLAGWPTDRPVWTASLPCQPFSTAGKQLGTDDERHLSPTFLELVRQCRPSSLFGEQVASKLARTDWLPGIRLELEALGYSFGAADLCAPCAGEVGEGRIVRGDQESWERVIIGAPHIRQRLYWVADAHGRGLSECSQRHIDTTQPRLQTPCGNDSSGRGEILSTTDGLAQPRDIGAGSLSGASSGCGGGTVDAGAASLRQAYGQTGTSGADPRSSGESWKRVSFAADCLGYDEETGELGDECSICGLTYAEDCECPGPTHDGYEYEERDGTLFARWVGDTGSEGSQGFTRNESDRSEPGRVDQEQVRPARSPGWTLLPCRDGKTRRTQSGIFPLVNGIPRGVVPSGDPSDPSYANDTAEARAVRLKGYGNAIVPPLAAMFIKTYMEVADA